MIVSVGEPKYPPPMTARQLGELYEVARENLESLGNHQPTARQVHAELERLVKMNARTI